MYSDIKKNYSSHEKKKNSKFLCSHRDGRYYFQYDSILS